MSTIIPSQTKVDAIRANLDALNALLTVALIQSKEACHLIRIGECNGAIGTVLQLDVILDDARALYRAAMAIHRLNVI